MSVPSTLARIVLVIAWLAGPGPGCDRKAASTHEAPPAKPAGAPADPWAARPSPAAGDPMSDLRDLATSLQRQVDDISARHRAQIDKLEQQIAEIQQLLDAGKYDQAELHLVDIHWRTEDREHDNADLARLYDEKRAALTAFLNRKRPVPAAP